MVSSVGSMGPKSLLYLPCPMCILPARVFKVPCRAFLIGSSKHMGE